LIGVDEAQALLGPLWNPYKEEFNQLQPPVELKVFAEHATKVLNNLVQTGRVSCCVDGGRGVGNVAVPPCERRLLCVLIGIFTS
jgi:hypothetical protein